MKSLLATATHASHVLAVQLLALVTLSPTEFGAFSIQYLVYAFGSSLSLSLVSEAWIRSDLRDNSRSTWREYSAVSVYLAVGMGVLTVAVSLIFPPLRPVALAGFIAVTATVYRGAARFYSLRTGESRGVLWGDLAGLVGVVATWSVLMIFGARDLGMMTAAWALGALASAIFSKRPAVPHFSAISAWWNQHNQNIRPLLRDSLLMDAGAIGTPYLLTPILGLAQFGTYRAISNIAAPVRLILNPIRPQVAATPIATQRSLRRAGIVFAASLTLGLAAYACLRAIGYFDVDLGALSSVVSFAIPAALFVTSNFLGHYFYIVARAHLNGRELLIGRVVQTVLAIVIPVGSALLSGLPGAIWGFAISTAISATCWSFLVLVLRIPDRDTP